MEAHKKILDKGTIYKGKTRVRHLRQLRKTATKIRANPKDRITACGMPAQAEVSVVSSQQGSKFRGTWSCDQVHTCPVCAAKIQARRTQEISKVIGAKEFSIYLTLTLSHTREDKLKDSLKTLTKCWNNVRTGTFGRRAKKYGQVGFVRSLDITFSNKSGFHPHYAILLIFDRAPTEEQIEELKEICFRSWKSSVEKEGRQAVSDGFYFAPLTNPELTAQYLSKINSIAWEVASNTHKQAKGDHLNPWEILDLAEKSPYFTKVWRDYAKGIKGARAIHSSKSFKKMLEEIEEEEELEEEVEQEVLIKFRSTLYKHIRKIGDDCKILEVCDRSLAGDNDAQLLLKGIKKISTLCSVSSYFTEKNPEDYEQKVWFPLHNQLSLFSSA
jgi:hypothetical protein